MYDFKFYVKKMLQFTKPPFSQFVHITFSILYSGQNWGQFSGQNSGQQKSIGVYWQAAMTKCIHLHLCPSVMDHHIAPSPDRSNPNFPSASSDAHSVHLRLVPNISTTKEFLMNTILRTSHFQLAFGRGGGLLIPNEISYLAI